MDDAIARRWRELSGENNWEGLLQPLDPDLRRYIIHYGQMVRAVGDLFNSDTRRPNASAEELFSQACLVRVAVEQLVNRYEAEDISITVTGFSLGAALATLTAMDIVSHGYNNPPTVSRSWSQPLHSAIHVLGMCIRYTRTSKPEHRIVPSYWWVGENRSRMVQRDDGRWITRDV
ncbi:hypothetical protein V6N13_004078 [Hibiscus sabdariffa]|uniref:Phospholipase A1 n=1 Tax=Hibiscus sabdariffa TaxID=183260 RepID=A0ABR2RY04_9ROSI